MPQTTHATLVAFPRSKLVQQDHRDTDPEDHSTLTDLAVGAHRAQVRVPLLDLDQAERALIVLQQAVERSLTQIRSARRRDDNTALAAVRQLLAGASRLINSRSRTTNT